jgi:3'(2'), 5'-bisphosphate nucleotidase
MTATDPMPDFPSLLDLALSAALDAGKAVLEVYHSDFAVECKDDRSPLTLADQRSHEIIAGRLAANEAGGLPILSEEGRNIPYEERKRWEAFWLVDPVDGTKEFIRRNGEFTVNIALIRQGRPVLGVILVPVKDTLYYAGEGLGAWRLDNASTDNAARGRAARLPVPGSSGRPFTAVASRSHLSPETEAYLQELRKQQGTLEVVSAGSSLKFCLVAEGRADVYPRFGPTMEWDTAAGHAIVVEAGGTVVRADDKAEMTYNKEDLLNPWFIASRK